MAHLLLPIHKTKPHQHNLQLFYCCLCVFSPNSSACTQELVLLYCYFRTDGFRSRFHNGLFFCGYVKFSAFSFIASKPVTANKWWRYFYVPCPSVSVCIEPGSLAWAHRCPTQQEQCSLTNGDKNPNQAVTIAEICVSPGFGERTSFPEGNWKKTCFHTRRLFFQLVFPSTLWVLPLNYCSCRYLLKAQMWIKKNFNWNQRATWLCFLSLFVSVTKTRFLVTWNITLLGDFTSFFCLVGHFLCTCFSFTVIIKKKKATRLLSGFPKISSLFVMTLQLYFPSVLLTKELKHIFGLLSI